MGTEMYEFRVDGRLRENAGEALCGMLVEEVQPGLVLRGAVIDEPHLLGIINELRVLGLSIVSVRPVARPSHAARRPTAVAAAAPDTPRAARRLLRSAGKRRSE